MKITIFGYEITVEKVYNARNIICEDCGQMTLARADINICKQCHEAAVAAATAEDWMQCQAERTLRAKG